MSGLSEYTTEQLMDELERRKKEEFRDRIRIMLSRLEGDINFIKNMTTNGAPGHGGYKVTFEVYK